MTISLKTDKGNDIYKISSQLLLKIAEDNDIYEITINGTTYDLYTIYKSPYGKIFDELNLAVDVL
tara:strand:- start:790 stop:984 length:195 start_codon:yes stop_codon:yes gene_type:complete